MAKPINKETITEWFKGLQDHICHEIEALEATAQFKEDVWERPGGGGGRSRILEGSVIEKGGVNFSAVHGPTPEKILKALGLEQSDFFATGVSIVMHPTNPHVPIIHMNVRYFEMSNGTKWFGGGIDLTPHYITEEQAAYFHASLRSVCDKHDSSYYPKFKKWADDYFYIHHRKETRGIGGIFFDRLTPEDDDHFSTLFDFVKDVGNSFAPLYTQFVRKNMLTPYDETHKKWQWIRRSRYAEFNLVYDKGTKFGLETDGRIESILMSMPPVATWVYNHTPEAGSAEESTLQLLKKDINWASKL